MKPGAKKLCRETGAFPYPREINGEVVQAIVL